MVSQFNLHTDLTSLNSATMCGVTKFLVVPFQVHLLHAHPFHVEKLRMNGDMLLKVGQRFSDKGGRYLRVGSWMGESGEKY